MWQNAGKAGLDQWNFTLLPTSRSQARASRVSVPNGCRLSLSEVSQMKSGSRLCGGRDLQAVRHANPDGERRRA